MNCRRREEKGVNYLEKHRKRYAPYNKVGVEVVRGLYGVTEMKKANLGLIVTSSSFTKDAIEEKVRIGSRIDLKAFSDLRSWLSVVEVQT